jgi:hypothetical protein
MMMRGEKEIIMIGCRGCSGIYCGAWDICQSPVKINKGVKIEKGNSKEDQDTVDVITRDQNIGK